MTQHHMFFGTGGKQNVNGSNLTKFSGFGSPSLKILHTNPAMAMASAGDCQEKVLPLNFSSNKKQL